MPAGTLRMNSTKQYRAADLFLPPGYTEDDLKRAAARRLHVAPQDITSIELMRLGVDARRRARVHYTASALCTLAPGVRTGRLEPYVPRTYTFPYKNLTSSSRPVVVGSGPAGIFCALELARAGLRPILLEQGAAVEQRVADVMAFTRGGPLLPLSNIQFGEGGAGTFSDGKLHTGTRDLRQRRVLENYVAAGAPADILYLAKPHIGTDRLRAVAANMRAELRSLGADVLFGTRFAGLITKGGRLAGIWVEDAGGRRQIDAEQLILAPGNGARETFRLLSEQGLRLEAKNFAVGVRIEHRQDAIDVAQYGTIADYKALPAADYKLSYHARNGRSAYSFCVCPGGTVVPGASGPGQVVTNGMSEYARDGRNINGALIVSVTAQDYPGDDPLAGIRFQEELERAAFEAGGGNFHAPVQLVGDFLASRLSASFRSVQPTYRPGTTFADLGSVLPEYVSETLREALPAFGRRIDGFDAADAVLTGVETRTSSPVRIVRGENGETNIPGVFACGEGAGYAGGITSSAVDGIRCAENVCAQIV